MKGNWPGLAAEKEGNEQIPPPGPAVASGVRPGLGQSWLPRYCPQDRGPVADTHCLPLTSWRTERPGAWRQGPPAVTPPSQYGASAPLGQKWSPSPSPRGGPQEACPPSPLSRSHHEGVQGSSRPSPAGPLSRGTQDSRTSLPSPPQSAELRSTVLPHPVSPARPHPPDIHAACGKQLRLVGGWLLGSS